MNLWITACNMVLIWVIVHQFAPGVASGQVAMLPTPTVHQISQHRTSFEAPTNTTPADRTPAGGTLRASASQTAGSTVAAGLDHTCDVQSSGAARCWGNNYAGQLGNAAGNEIITNPVNVQGGLRFSSLTAGDNLTCGISVEGDALCWGWNNWGEVGDGSKIDRRIPASVSLPYSVSLSAISAGSGFACGVTTAGKALCWGNNYHGQLGTGTSGNSSSSSVPTEIITASGLALTVVVTGQTHACALSAQGAVWWWGNNASGQLGNGRSGDTTTFRATPVAVQMPTGVQFTVIAAGQDHTCALTQSGTGYCWGANTYGQLGTGSGIVSRTVPTAVQQPGGVTFKKLVAGGTHTCALTVGNMAYCWGNNGRGQLGSGSNSPSNPEPVAVHMPQGITFSDIAVGGTVWTGHSCAQTEAKVTFCWGANNGGQLGDGTRDDRLTPTLVGGPEITAVQVNRQLSDGTSSPGSTIATSSSGDRVRTVAVTGRNFQESATASFSVPHLTVQSIARTSSTSLNLSVKVARDAPAGSSVLTIRNADGVTATFPDAVIIVSRPSSLLFAPSSVLVGSTNLSLTVTGANMSTSARIRIEPNPGDIAFTIQSANATQIGLLVSVSSGARANGVMRSIYVDNRDESGEVLASGQIQLTSGTSVADPILLVAGWNLVALTSPPTYSVTAETVCGAINSANGPGTATEIDQWIDGGWSGHICGIPANNFNLPFGRGFFVRTIKSGSFTSPT